MSYNSDLWRKRLANGSFRTPPSKGGNGQAVLIPPSGVTQGSILDIDANAEPSNTAFGTN